MSNCKYYRNTEHYTGASTFSVRVKYNIDMFVSSYFLFGTVIPSVVGGIIGAAANRDCNQKEY